jgi:hypothetical protein
MVPFGGGDGADPLTGTSAGLGNTVSREALLKTI